MPGSRSNSPPITLPPLKLLSASPPSQKRGRGLDVAEGMLLFQCGAAKDSFDSGTSAEDVKDSLDTSKAVNGDSDKIELPRFKDFEAATLGSRPPHDSKMSIDFVC